MDGKKEKMFLKYISYLYEGGTPYNIKAYYIKAVKDFLEKSESVSRRGYYRYRKKYAIDILSNRYSLEGICDFLNVNDIGFSRDRKKTISPLEKLSVISERNQEIINGFLNKLSDDHDYSINTLYSYSHSVRKFYEYSNDFSLENCKRFIATLENEGLSPKTIRLRITALEKLGEYLNKPLKLKRPKFKRSLQTDNIPTQEEYNRLLSYLSTHKNKDYYFFIKILASTGARISEFLEFKWEDIINGETTIKGKGNKYRRFFFSTSLQKEARDYTKKENKVGYVAMGKYGRITSRGISENMKSWGRKCNIDTSKMHPHAFRHFFAKMYLKKNNDIIQLADLLGHGSIETTRIYLQKSYDEQKAEFNRSVTW